MNVAYIYQNDIEAEFFNKPNVNIKLFS